MKDLLFVVFLGKDFQYIRIKVFRHSHSTYLSKKALSSVEILTKELADIQQMNKTKTPPAIPSSVSIEVCFLKNYSNLKIYNLKALLKW